MKNVDRHGRRHYHFHCSLRGRDYRVECGKVYDNGKCFGKCGNMCTLGPNIETRCCQKDFTEGKCNLRVERPRVCLFDCNFRGN